MSTPSTKPVVLVTKGFLRSYRKASVPLQRLAEGAVRDFVLRYRANPTKCLQSYDRVAGSRDDLLEMDLAGAPRLIAAARSGSLCLLDLGGHEATKLWAHRSLPSLADAQPAPPQFMPEAGNGFFLSLPDKEQSYFTKELDPDWLYFLDAEQAAVLETLEDRVIQIVLGDGAKLLSGVVWLMGGAGTGKTCVLLNLLKWAVDAKLKVTIQLTDRLGEYITASSDCDIASYREISEDDKFLFRQTGLPEEQVEDPDYLDLLLVDDPRSVEGIRSAMDRVLQGKVGLCVLGFDPLQLQDAVTDEQLLQLAHEYDAEQLELHNCYRQKANVGQSALKAMDAIATSTPFLAHEKIKRYQEERRTLTRLANTLTFPNKKGYVEVHSPATEADVASEVRRLLAGPLWLHWPPLLIAADENLAEAVRNWEHLWTDVRSQIVWLSALREIKGLEFQHCFLFIDSQLYHDVELGFKGSGQSVYNFRRLLRIPFSRAKDSIATFVIETKREREESTRKLPF